MCHKKLLLLVGCLITSQAVVAASARHRHHGRRAGVGISGNASGPWQAAPWLVPHGRALPYEDLSADLDALLAVQARPAASGAGHRRGSGLRVTLTLYTAALRPLLLNWVYTLVSFGGVEGFLVAVVDAQSLQDCISLRLPCWDARDVLGLAELHGAEEQLHSPAGSTYSKLTHGKPSLALQVLRRGYDLHFADADMVFVRDVWRSFDVLLEAIEADGSFMREEKRFVNSGHYVMLYNLRTLAFMEAWAGDRVEKWAFLSDQEWLRSPYLFGPAWMACEGPQEAAMAGATLQSCAEVAASGRAAVYAYVEQGRPMPFGGCLNRFEYQHCAPWQVGLHYICMRGQADKIDLIKRHGLWFVGEGGDPATTPTTWFGSPSHQAGTSEAARHNGSRLPCEDAVAQLRRQPDPPEDTPQ